MKSPTKAALSHSTSELNLQYLNVESTCLLVGRSLRHSVIHACLITDQRVDHQPSRSGYSPSANEMVVAVVPFARLSRRAGVVDGEDSEKRVEQKAAHGKPLN